MTLGALENQWTSAQLSSYFKHLMIRLQGPCMQWPAQDPQCLAHVDTYHICDEWRNGWMPILLFRWHTQHLEFHHRKDGFRTHCKESGTTQGYSVRVECYSDPISILQDEAMVTARGRGAFHAIQAVVCAEVASVEQLLKPCLWGAILQGSVMVPGFEPQLCCYLRYLPVWSWASDLTSLRP